MSGNNSEITNDLIAMQFTDATACRDRAESILINALPEIKKTTYYSNNCFEPIHTILWSHDSKKIKS